MNDTPADDVGPMDSPPLRVMVVDDHPMWRDAVERDLTAAGLQIVATAATGGEAVNRARATRPSVVVLDLNIPEPNGVDVTATLVAEDPTVRILVLSASGEQSDVLEAVKAGATGYLVKSASRTELLDTLTVSEICPTSSTIFAVTGVFGRTLILLTAVLKPLNVTVIV